MSSLWSARVLTKDNRRIVVELRAIHPDSGEFLATKRFALRLLYDEAYRYGPGSVREPTGPLGEAIALEQTFDDAFLDSNADRFIERVALGNVRNAPLDVEALRDRFDSEVAGGGVRRDDRAAWSAAWDARWDAFWTDPANLPAATYTIDVTDPRWIAHLDVASQWDSAAY
jgi:hypothetical protein